MRNPQVKCAMLALCLVAASGCGNRPIEGTARVRLSYNPATAVDTSTGPQATSTAPNAPEKSPVKKAPLQDLKWSLPRGWTAEYDGVFHWKVAKNVPPDYSVVLVWPLLPGQQPRSLFDFSQRLQTSSELTEGTHIMDRQKEQGEFSDGYYVVGKFFPRSNRSAKKLGFAMIRRLGGHTLIFECFKVNDAAERQEAIDICKAAKF